MVFLDVRLFKVLEKNPSKYSYQMVVKNGDLPLVESVKNRQLDKEKFEESLPECSELSLI